LLRQTLAGARTGTVVNTIPMAWLVSDAQAAWPIETRQDVIVALRVII